MNNNWSKENYQTFLNYLNTINMTNEEFNKLLKEVQ